MNALTRMRAVAVVLSVLFLSSSSNASEGRITMQAAPHIRSVDAPSNTFDGFVRYPAEVRNFEFMENATAYFRDVFVGGNTTHTEAADGDSIHAQMFGPTGALIQTWPKTVFHTSYQGEQNCWVSGFERFCDAPDVFVTWYRTSQCAQDGEYTMKFFRNDVEFHSGKFTILPQLPPDTVPQYDQLSFPTTPYDKWCYTVNTAGARIPKTNHTCNSPLQENERQYSIKAKGCYMSSAAAVMSYHGQATTVEGLNTILNDASDGFVGGNVNPQRAAMYATRQGTKMKFLGRATNLGTAICTYGPQLMGVKCSGGNASHWVTVTGMSKDKSTWLIMDPAGGANTTLAAKYGNNFCTTRTFQGPEYNFTTEKGLLLTFHSPVSLLLSDPQGRRIGDDPLTGQSFDEIASAYYDAGGLEDDETGEADEEPTKVLHLPDPVNGQYSLQVTGTDNGTYSSEFIFYDDSGEASESDLRNIAIGLNEVHTFSFTYDSTPGATTQISGGFNGGGQRPRDVNRFLSYGNPADSPVNLPAGTSGFPLMLFYAAETLPATFSAVLNGVDVRHLFHPEAGKGEVVVLPLKSGRNILELSIQGNLPSRAATDTDRLVLSVP